MSAPPEQQADRVTIPVKLRPKLAAFVRSLGEPLGLTDRQVIAMLIEDLAMRGAEAHAKRHVIVVRRGQPFRPQPERQPDEAA